MTRREFIWFSSMAVAGVVIGCATDPVTGKRQFVLVSEDEEIQIDKQYSPIQFSADYGVTQDKKLNAYIDRVGKKMAARTQRPHMPYNFQVVNATYINAYAFPGGSIAATRGILLKLENEAELASLLGHELGHVNARHAAEQMSKSKLSQVVVGGLSAALGSGYGDLAGMLGSIASGALLASYSRDNEREADALGMKYMVDADYGSDGFVGLMDMLNSLSKSKPSAAELLFATHPMSDERYQTAVKEAQTTYKSVQKKPLYRERYMDNIAKLRAQKSAIEQIQKGQENLMKKKYDDADNHFRKALKKAPDDYAGLVLMATSQLIQQKWAVGRQYAEMAQKAYPQEARAYFLSGYANVKLKDYKAAYREFNKNEKLLPGNLTTVYFKGYSQEKMKHIPEAAKEYDRFLKMGGQGDHARHAYNRLVKWGYY
jgi:predicted Zn-dependent protease